MAYNEHISQRISAQLKDRSISFTEKKMFGGLTYMINDKMCIGVIKDEILLRVLDEKYDELLEQNHVNPMKFTGKIMKGFLFIEEAVFRTENELSDWIDLGLEFGIYGVVKSKQTKKG